MLKELIFGNLRGKMEIQSNPDIKSNEKSDTWIVLSTLIPERKEESNRHWFSLSSIKRILCASRQFKEAKRSFQSSGRNFQISIKLEGNL